MDIKILLLLLTVALAANGSIPQSDFDHQHFRFMTNYGDVLKSLYLIDFHLTDMEKENINKYFQEISGITSEEISTIKKLKDIKEAALKSIAKVKLPNVKKFEGTDHNYSTLMLALNYDLVAQILDPDYDKNVFTLPLESGQERTEAQIAILDVISKRWASDLTGHGVSVPGGSLSNFYNGTEDEVKMRKNSVHRIYETLDRFVLESLGSANAKYGSYPYHTIGRSPPPPPPPNFWEYNKPEAIHKSPEKPSDIDNNKNDHKEADTSHQVKDTE